MSLIPNPTGLVPNAVIINLKNGQWSNDGRNLIQALFNRTGGPPGVPNVQVGLIVTGDVFGITGDWNEFDTVAGGGVAQLPDMVVGSDCIIYNGDAANALSITPQPGVQIDALGFGVGYVLANTKMQWFRAWTPTQIRSMQLG